MTNHNADPDDACDRCGGEPSTCGCEVCDRCGDLLDGLLVDATGCEHCAAAAAAATAA